MFTVVMVFSVMLDSFIMVCSDSGGWTSHGAK